MDASTPADHPAPTSAGAAGAGRHSGPSTWRSRHPRLFVVAPVAALAVVGGTVYGVVAGATPAAACQGGEQTLSVAAAPEIASVLTDLLEPTAPDPATGATCRRVQVDPVDPADVAQALGSSGDSSAGASAAPLPDVWIPDSSIWLGEAGVTGSHPSLATTPVVAAVTGARDWPADVATLLTSDAESRLGLRLVLPDPRASAASTAVVAGLSQAAIAEPGLRPGVTRTLRQAVPSQVSEADVLLETLTPDHAVAVGEQAVWAHNVASEPERRVTAVYPSLTGAVLDYPFVVLGDTEAADGWAAEVLELLRGPSGAIALAAHGFRDTTGGFAEDPAAPPGVDAARAVPVQVLNGASRTSATDILAQLSLGSQMLAVIDVSGSMAARVDGGPRRLDLVKDAAVTALTVMPPNSSVGLWVFATGMPDGAEQRELVPMGPLDEVAGGVPRASLLAGALESTTAVPDGGTPLYDTTLAAVRSVRDQWDPRRVNTVVLLSDGRNEDRESVSLEELLTTLAAEADPLRPVPVITIAYGPDADAEALARIADATAGAAYTAPEPHQIESVFLDAVGQRLCRPNC